MRILKGFLLVLALAFAAVSARAAAPIQLVVPALSFSPAACRLVMPAAAAGFAPAFSVSPADHIPSLLLPPAVPAVTARPSIIRGLNSIPVAGDAPASDGAAWRYAGFFDGAVPASDGASVSPRLADSDGPIFRLPLQLDALRGAMERALPALRDSVALGQWNGPHTTLDESCCGDAATKLALLLRAQGIPARLVEAEFHYYVLLDLPDGQIVVDPTVRQFFGKKQAPKSIPQVFVGAIADLHAFFERHAASRTTRYDPSRIYFREAVIREDELRAFEAKVRDGGDTEHDPLRRFLGLPPAAPCPPSRARLIIL